MTLALAMGGCFGQDAPVVQTERVVAGEVVQVVAAPGRVEAAARQDVAAGVSGTVVALHAADGDQVNAGQTVVQLSSEQVDAARAQVGAAQAAAEPAGVAVPAGADEPRSAAQQAVADLDAEAKPRIAEARARAAAVEDPPQRAAAEAAIDAVEASYAATRAALLASGEAIASAQEGFARSLSAALNQALEAAAAPQRAQAAAAASAVQRQADLLQVTAPFGGTVVLGGAAVAGAGDGLAAALAGAGGDGAGLAGFGGAGGLSGLAGLAAGAGAGGAGGTLRVGAPVSAGQVLFTIYDLTRRYVVVDVDEIDAPQLRAGQRARVVVDAFPDAAFDGVVEQVALAAAPTATGGVGYPVRIRLAGADGDAGLQDLRVGMTASADITTRTEVADLTVPTRALLRRDGGSAVLVVRDGVVEQVAVEVLALGEERAAVRGPVRAGERVVVTGFEALPDGTRVRLR